MTPALARLDEKLRRAILFYFPPTMGTPKQHCMCGRNPEAHDAEMKRACRRAFTLEAPQ